MSTQDMIEKRLRIINDLTQELKEISAQLGDILDNDPEYQQAKEEMTRIKDESKDTKQKILDTSMVRSISEKIKDKRTELKEHKEALSQELVDYYRETGSPEFLDSEGEVKRMKFSVKLVN